MTGKQKVDKSEHLKKLFTQKEILRLTQYDKKQKKVNKGEHFLKVFILLTS